MSFINRNSPHSPVSIARVVNYQLDELVPAVAKSLEMIGGLSSLIKPGARVFVKINHLPPPSPPERGIVTHPVFVEAVLMKLKETGAVITVGDDIEESEGDGFKISGFRDMCNRVGIKLVNLREAGFVERECEGEILKSVYVSKIVLESDVIIDLPKFKTHSLTTFTGAVKNMYGVIPSGLRRRFHGDYSGIPDFCRMLVDIFSIAKPQLTIMDGITAMEGEGPGSGHLRNLGLILTSTDAVALDAVAARLIGLSPDKVLTTLYAHERGLGIGDLNEIQVVGESLESAAVTDFKLPVNISRTLVNRAPRGLVRFFLGQISPRPHVFKKNCIACKECVRVCPTHAAVMTDGKAFINDKLCIRCMCCHEVCRYNAIVQRRPFIGRLMHGLIGVIRKPVKI